MSTQFPLDAYLARLDWTSAARPVADASTLDALVLAHTMAIPFENLDPLRRKPVAVDSETVAAKLIDARRGGFCFEHGRLFADALRALGYPVRELAARVMWMQPDDALTPQSHMLLDVDTPDGERLGALAGGEGMLVVDLDRSQRENWRERFPYLEGRRPALYGELLKR